MLKFPNKFFLASGSPRRAVLLKQINIDFEILKIDTEETLLPDLTPAELSENIAIDKAIKSAEKLESGILFSADTMVVIDSVILGKPKDKSDAFCMLERLSGKVHRVITGFCFYDIKTKYLFSDHETTLVKFININTDLINEYIQTGSPMDKAGAYGIQDSFGSIFVEKIEGCYYNVMGLPLSKFYKSANEFISKLNAKNEL